MAWAGRGARVSLRMHGDLKAVPQSVVTGQGVVVEVKVENPGSAPARVRLDVELRAVGGRPPQGDVRFEPAADQVGPKKREHVRFIWRAGLPAGVTSLTYRGTLILRDSATGADLGKGVLDVYVRSA